MSPEQKSEKKQETKKDKTESLLQRKPSYMSLKFWIVLLVAIMVYAYGWKATQINPKMMVTDAHLIAPLVHDLLAPNIIAKNAKTMEVKAPFQVPCQGKPPVEPPLLSTKPSITISKACGNFGDTITVKASGLRPNTSGELWWENPISNRDLIMDAKSDKSGKFQATFEVPKEMASPGEIHHVVLDLTWPTGGYHFTKTAGLVLNKIIETIFLALMATTLAIFIAIPVSFLAARNLMTGSLIGTIVYYITRTFLNIFRSIEPLIWGLIFVVWVGIGPFAGVLALTVHSVAALGKLYSEAIESIDPGPIEAITATGANRLQVIVYAVIPQMIPPFIAFTLYRWDINVRMSTVIGLVGGGGIGYLLIQWINLLQYRNAAAAVWAITIVVWALDYISAVVRERLV